MNVTLLNTINLDDGLFIKKGGGTTSGGSGGGSTPTKPKYTGHADAEGLRAIGWTDEDIAYYQENGVNWNEEEDEYHKVTDDNKALYGVLTADNISTYISRIVYLPKIDTSNTVTTHRMFYGCPSLVAIPLLDTSNVVVMSYMFANCKTLAHIPQLNTTKVKDMSYMFSSCHSLTTIPQLDTSNVTNMAYMFKQCFSLVAIPFLDTSKVTNMQYMFQQCSSLTTIPQLDTSNVTSIYYTFDQCLSLPSIPLLDTSKISIISSAFGFCHSLTHLELKNANLGYQLSYSPLLSKESLLYLINNEAATSAIIITLHSYAYDKWATDADVVAALANHPNITISK